MSIQSDVEVDLRNQEVVNFLFSSENEFLDPKLNRLQEFTEDNGFEVAASPILVGSHSETAVAVELKKYNVYNRESGGLVSSFIAPVPWHYYIFINIFSEPWVLSSLGDDRKAELKAIFDRYDPKMHSDPHKYAYDEGVSSDEYEVISFFGLKKDDSQAPVEFNGAEINLIDQVNPEINVAVYHSSVYANHVPDPVPDAVDPKNPNNPNTIEEKIDEIASNGRCDGFKYHIKEVGRIAQVQEFQLRWEPYWIKIGCIKTKVNFYKLYTQTSQYFLSAVVVHSVNPIKPILYAIETCSKSAISSPVVLVPAATLNFVAAAKAFIALFLDCFINKIGEIVQCLVPDLIVEKKSTDWSPV